MAGMLAGVLPICYVIYGCGWQLHTSETTSRNMGDSSLSSIGCLQTALHQCHGADIEG